MEDMLNKDEPIENKFRLAILAARRAKQLINGRKKKIELSAENPLTIALEEINQGVVDYNTLKNNFEDLIEQEQDVNEDDSSTEGEGEENPEEEKEIKN